VPSFVALVPFLWLLEERAEGPGARGTGDWADVLRTGYWFGALANGLVLYWIAVALWHFTRSPSPGTSGPSSSCSRRAGCSSLAYVHVRRRRGCRRGSFSAAVDRAGVGRGAPRRRPLPLAGARHSLTRVPVLVQWAELGGARGVTLWLAWVNVAAYLLLRRRAWRAAALAALTLALALAFGVWRSGRWSCAR